MLGQFAVHLGVMYWAVNSAKKHLPDDYEVELDGEFKVSARNFKATSCTSLLTSSIHPSHTTRFRSFQPGLVNTVVFLVSNVQQVTVFVVNLKGRPFMNGLTENRPLLYSLAATFILVFMFASESMPGLNKYFQLVPFPEEAYRNWMLSVLAGNVLLTFCWDRLMQFVFAPKILFASMEGTTLKDVMVLARTLAMIGGGLYMLLGDDAQWEELMVEEGRFDELGMDFPNATNATNSSDDIGVGGVGDGIGSEL